MSHYNPMFNRPQFKSINNSFKSNNNSVNNSFSSRIGFEPVRQPMHSTLLNEKRHKQQNEVAGAEAIFEHIKNPIDLSVLNSREREFISQVADLMDLSESNVGFVEEPWIFNPESQDTQGDNALFIVPQFNKGTGELASKFAPKENPNMSQIFSCIYSEDKDRKRFMDYLKSQPSFKMYHETDKLACLDDLFGQEYNPTIFQTLYKLLVKIFKSESIKASDFQLTPNEYLILESVLVRKYDAKIDKRQANQPRQVANRENAGQPQRLPVRQTIRGKPEVRLQTMLKGPQEKPA
jgi:hypothetical protein